MQTKVNELTLAKTFELSQFIKGKCKDKSTLEETAQELMKTLYQIFITDSSKSAIVLTRFFKSCSYCDLPDDIQGYIKQKEDRAIIPPQDKYLTLLGTYGDLEEWRHREKSENYKAFSLNDSNVFYKSPMLSAVFNQIGFTIPTATEPNNGVIVDKQDIDYGLFYVEDAKDSKFIPKQAEFVVPFGVKSAFGFGGHYVSTDVYAVIIFYRENISLKIAKLFLSLNPVIKLLTLRHVLTENIFNVEGLSGSSVSKPSEALKEIQDESPIQKIEYVIKCEEAKAIADEVMKANEALIKTAEELKEKNIKLMEEVSKRKQVEEAMRGSEEKYQKLIEIANDAVFVADIESGMFVDANKSAEELLGIPIKEIVGMHHTHMYSPEDVEYTTNLFKKYAQMNKAITLEEIFVQHKDGHKIPVEISTSVYERGGRKVMQGIFRDVTERKRVEDKFIAYQTQLKRLSSTLSLTEERERRRISDDLHDRIGQALTVIKMKLEELRDPQVDTDSNLVLNETEELLDNAIQDTRTLTFEISPPLLYELGFEPAVEWLIEQFRERHNIPIEYEGKCDSDDRKLDDDVSFFLFKSVRELLFNAIKHASPDRIKVSVRREKNSIRISIQDDGVGFDFSKVQFSVNNLSGFGLFSMRERMEHFGGDFDVKSKPGKGTRITLIMSMKPEEEDWVKWIKR